MRRRRSQRSDRDYLARRDALKRRTRRYGLRCWICGAGFDFSLDYRDPMAWTADHVHPVASGGAMLGELRPAHRSCNSRRGAFRDVAAVPKPKTARRW